MTTHRSRAFTRLEWIVLLLIVAVLGAMARSNSRATRRARNEGVAVGVLKAYAAAQEVYYQGTHTGTTPHGTYASDFALLGSASPGLDPGHPLFAEAGGPGGTQWSGYLFRELDAGVDWKSQFNLGATPAEYRVTGVLSFYVDQAGTVYWKDLQRGPLPGAVPAGRSDGWYPVDE